MNATNDKSAWASATVRLVAGVALTLATMTGTAHAQTPPAGLRIGNQAVATYTDGSGIPRVVTSNLVETTITQVAAVAIDAPSALFGQQGSQVVFPHRITNNGNGTDSFTISLVQLGTDNFNLNTLQIFADTNSDGVPDNLLSPITTTNPLAPGEVFTFVVAGVIPSPQANGNFAEIEVRATSVFDVAVNTGAANNTVGSPLTDLDRVTATNQGIIEIQKSMTSQAGPADGVTLVTVEIKYGNTGLATATGVTLTDALPQVGAGGLDYVAGSGRWSVSGLGTPLTDPAAGDPAGIDFTGDVGTDTVTAVIASVPPSTQGFIRFQFTARVGTAAGTLVNTATVAYNDGVAAIGPLNSNPVPYVIGTSPGVTLVGPAPVASIPQGGTVSFTNVVTNTGNRTDTMDITLSGSTYPAGSTFTMYKADGVSLLLDTNSTGIPDTGPLAVGASYNVILRVTVPPGVSGGGPYTVNKTATTQNVDATNTPATATDDDTLTTITAGTVDLTDSFSTDGGAEAGGSGTDPAVYPGTTADGIGDGQGAGPEALYVRRRIGSPGQTVTFDLVVNVGSDPADTFNLAAFSDAGLTTAFPWSVVFKDRTGATITNTGTLSNGATNVANEIVVGATGADGADEKLIRATVSIPAGQAPGAVPIFFRALSPTTAVSDAIRQEINVNTSRLVRLTPDNQQKQTFAGGNVVYPHILENFGNVTECQGQATGSDCFLALTDSNAISYNNSQIYLDINDDGVLDVGDPIVPNGTTPLHTVAGVPANFVNGLSPGERFRIFVQVLATAGATAGDANDTVVTATVTDGAPLNFTTVTGAAVPDPTVPTVTDHTIVVFGDLELTKVQALDAACDGTPDAAYGRAVINARPGQCVRYRLTLVNTGTAAATGSSLADSTPVYTTLHDGDGAVGATGQPSFQLNGGGFTAVTTADPGPGGTGAVREALGTLNPADSVNLFFGVRVDP